MDPLLIKPRSKEIIAMTSNTCINPVALYTNTPKSQPIINTTAIRNNMLLIIIDFAIKEWLKDCATQISLSLLRFLLQRVGFNFIDQWENERESGTL